MKTRKLNLNAQVWIEQDNCNLAGTTEINLLKAIVKTGSINKAAKELGRSYKWAWDTVAAMNALSKQPLLVRATGGKNGGGTRLTECGEQLVQGFLAASHAHEAYIKALSHEADNLNPKCLHLLNKLALKTSARNQLFGIVKAIQESERNDEIILQMQGYEVPLRILVTHPSSDYLDLSVGDEAVALIKALWVEIVPIGHKVPEGYNALPGEIFSLANGDAVLELAPNLKICGVVNSTHETNLKRGIPALAIFDHKSVILGVSC